MYKAKRISTVDDVTKYIYNFQGHSAEYTYIDNGTGKDIICIPSQTGCNLGCQFCFLTYRKDQSIKQLDASFSLSAITEIINEQRKSSNKTILISFMGSGDALLCPKYVQDITLGMVSITRGKYAYSRHGVATIAPTAKLLQEFTRTYMYQPVKLHWSLHHVKDSERAKYMPSAGKISTIAPLINEYRTVTGNPVEIHYSLFDGNSSSDNANELASLLNDYNFPVKILKFRERPDHALTDSTNTKQFIQILRDHNVKVEEYTPPGADVLSACGLFEVDA